MHLSQEYKMCTRRRRNEEIAKEKDVARWSATIYLPRLYYKQKYSLLAAIISRSNRSRIILQRIFSIFKNLFESPQRESVFMKRNVAFKENNVAF